MGTPADLRAPNPDCRKKARRHTLRSCVLELCALWAFSAAELCRVLGCSNPGELTRDHLKPMREAGQLTLLYPESAKHPHQARTVNRDKEQNGGA